MLERVLNSLKFLLILAVIFQSNTVKAQFFDGLKFGPEVGIDLSYRVPVLTESDPNGFLADLIKSRSEREYATFSPHLGFSLQRQRGKHIWKTGCYYRQFGYATNIEAAIEGSGALGDFEIVEVSMRERLNYLQVPISYTLISAKHIYFGAGLAIGALINHSTRTIIFHDDAPNTKTITKNEYDRAYQIAPQLNFGFTRPSGSNEIQVDFNFQINPIAPVQAPINDIYWNAGMSIAYLFKKVS